MSEERWRRRRVMNRRRWSCTEGTVIFKIANYFECIFAVSDPSIERTSL